MKAYLQIQLLRHGGKDNIVVLMHDTNAKQLTADALRDVITYLREQGYCFKNFYDIMDTVQLRSFCILSNAIADTKNELPNDMASQITFRPMQYM